MYRVSFIKYCTYWPIASHSKCYDNASKSVTQSDIYTILLYKSTQISQDWLHAIFWSFYSTMQQTTDDAKGIAMFWHKYYISMSCRTKTGF